MTKTQKHKVYHEKNKEKRNTYSREYRINQKKQGRLSAKKYYQANSIKVLLSLKEFQL